MADRESLNVNLLLRSGQAQNGSAQFNFSSANFSGYTVQQEVEFIWNAVPLQSKVRLELELNTMICGICARCLRECTLPLHVEKTYEVSEDELVGQYPEYPTLKDGVIDLKELAYGEIVMEAPPVLLCGEDCEGLCGVCGKLKAGCTCEGEPEAASVPDARWDALRMLLNENEK